MEESDRLTVAMLIVSRCRTEGIEAAKLGATAASCPYAEELERSGWLDGWMRWGGTKTPRRMPRGE
jgi:ribosome modulation factor